MSRATDEPTPLVPPTHYCRHCGYGIYYEVGVGWVDSVSGDDGGTYDLCTETWISDQEGHGPHVPGESIPGAVMS
ncbi:hypothetical protein [Nocardioides pakistanensis]